LRMNFRVLLARILILVKSFQKGITDMLSQKFTSKISYLIVMLFLGAIIISFALTGLGGGQSAQNSRGQTVAKVDGTPIGVSEYKRAYNQQINYYSQIMGGKSLSSKEIELFKIRKRALDSLISLKLTLNLADQIGIGPGKKEIIDEIKKVPIFLTNEQFDVIKYKQVLKSNRLTPGEFENNILEDLKNRKINSLLSYQLVSKQYIQDLLKYKSQKVQATAIKLYKNNLRQYINISPAETTKFIANKSNLGQLQSYYDDNKNQYNKPEMVKASHILIKGDDKSKIDKIAKELSVKNFHKLAKKYTQDPSGKDNGGSLGYFPRGKMVPEFDKVVFSMKVGSISKPIKTQFGHHLILLASKKPATAISFDSAKIGIAKKILQRSKNKELDLFVKKVATEIKSNFSNSNSLEKLKKKYGFQLETNKNLNRFDGAIGRIKLEEKDVSKVFSGSSTAYKIWDIDSPSHIVIFKTFPSKKMKKKKSSDSEVEENAQKFKISREIRNKIMQGLQEKAKIVTYGSLL